MKSIDKMIIPNLILFITILMLSFNCTDQEDTSGIGGPTDVPYIHFLEYNLDSINNKWGYDSLAGIYSAPLRDTFEFYCGIRIGIDKKPYDPMVIQEMEQINFIDSIRPFNLDIGENYINIFTGSSQTGITLLQVFGGLLCNSLIQYQASISKNC